MNGFLLIDKDINMTSHDVLMKLKRQLNIKKLGHTGTLDPFATGLMIVCLGDACKLSNTFTNMDKSYEGTFIFGYDYDTLDVTGKVVNKSDTIIDEALLDQAIIRLIKTTKQIPPLYSAIKKNGKKLYEYARKGIAVEVPERDILIESLTINSKLSDNEFTFSTSVSKGTYVRAIARDLGLLLNTFGALKTLRRTRVGNYKVINASKISDVDFDKSFISIKDYLSSYQTITLNNYLIGLVKNGVVLDERQVITNNAFVVKDETGEIIALYDVVGLNKYKPVLILKD